jgi:hypothetical protein
MNISVFEPNPVLATSKMSIPPIVDRRVVDPPSSMFSSRPLFNEDIQLRYLEESAGRQTPGSKNIKTSGSRQSMLLFPLLHALNRVNSCWLLLLLLLSRKKFHRRVEYSNYL